MDQMNNIHPVVAVAPMVFSNGATIVGQAVNRTGFRSATFLIALGTLSDADAEWAVTIKEGDTDNVSEHTPVNDVDLIGTEALAGFTHASDNSCRKIGYKGVKKYISIEIDDSVGNSTSAAVCVIALLGDPANAPTPNPPS